MSDTKEKTAANPVLATRPLTFPWETRDPFLFAVYHDDRYPAGNERFGPAASLAGRNMGSDFQSRDGWRMYHGEEVPGFPHHPHRGFETVTVVQRGIIDHSDSMGAAGRYGAGDTQWLTAGSGVQHAEMFPLLDQGQPNPLELFQIWVNLPAADKMTDPHFTMLWKEQVPRQVMRDEQGRESVITIVAGQLGALRPPSPPPRSWASRVDSDFAIWTVQLAPHARCTLPAAASAQTQRTLYFYQGSALRVGGHDVSAQQRIDVRADVSADLEAGADGARLLMLQARPIGEPVAMAGPFVMNTQQELVQARSDFMRTRFGGWPWQRPDPIHEQDGGGRFARHADGRVERPG